MHERPWLNKYDPDVPHEFAIPDVALPFFLRQSAYHFPERSAIIFKDLTIPYKDLEWAVDRLAMALHCNGLEKGEPVALALPNIPQFVIAFYAVLKAGGIVAAMNPYSKQHEMIAQVNQVGEYWLIGEFESYGMLKTVRAATNLKHIVVTRFEDVVRLSKSDGEKEAITIQLQDGDYYLTELLDQPWDELLPGISAETPAIYQFSGGTTGTPKAAIGLHGNLVANTLQFRSWLSGMHEGQEVVCAAIPLFHVYGMVIAMSLGIALGATLVLIQNGRDTQEILASIQKHKATLFPGVPNMYQAINQHPDVQTGLYDLHSIKACISGSAPLPLQVKEQFEKFTGGKLLEGYGLSEAPTATHCNPMYGENRSGSIGLPLPGVDCRIVDLEKGNEDVRPGEAGELIIHGAQVMHSYLNNPVETAQTIRDGWLYTGDIARMDEEGYFYLIDRKKDLIKVNGLQVWPREIEEVLLTHPAVKECAAAGIPDPGSGEAVKAWVVVHPGQLTTPEVLTLWCKEYLSHYKIPREICLVDQLPRSAVGKILRRELLRTNGQI